MLNLLRRGKKSVATLKKVQKMPELDDFLTNQDYEGAISLLNHKLKAANLDAEQQDSLHLWLAFGYFRLRKFEEAANVYSVMLEKDNAPAEIRVYLACCKFHMKQYLEARKIAEKCPKSPLFVRLMMNVSLRLHDERGILNYHGSLGSSLEDQLALASVHFSRMHYKDAGQVIQETLAKSNTLTGLNIPLALCYAKQELTAVAYNLVHHYLRSHPDSPFAKNLLAAIIYRTVTSKSSVEEGSALAKNVDQEYVTLVPELEAMLKRKIYPEAEYLIKHNLVLFKNCENALQVLPSLMKHVPEARLNLILFHLNRDNVSDAMGLCKDFDPVTPFEFIVKALTFLLHGKKINSKEHLKIAETFFQMVGESDLVQDTIMGRQAAAAYMFLAGKFDEVIVYLKSIEDYFVNNDAFLLNFAQAFYMDKKFKLAEDHFVRVSGPERDKLNFNLMLLRCYVKNKKMEKAWSITEKMWNPNERYALMKALANESYINKEYYDAVMAFDELEKQDPSQENWFGKRGACAGLFRMVHDNRDERKYQEQLKIVVDLIEKTSRPANSEFMLKNIKQWCSTHKIDLST